MRILILIITFIAFTSCSKKQAQDFELKYKNSSIIIEEDNRLKSKDSLRNFIKHLSATDEKFLYECSSFLISKNIVLSAAHCVYKNGRLKDVTVSQEFKAKHIWIAKEYIKKSVTKFDIALIQLEKDVSSFNTNINLRLESEDVYDLVVNVAGFSTDKSHELWQDECVIDIYESNYSINHACDTVGGVSGAPVFKKGNEPGSIDIFAIHTSGYRGILMTNDAIKITPIISKEIDIVRGSKFGELSFFTQLK